MHKPFLLRKTRHFPRLIKRGKIFALEIHKEILIYIKRKIFSRDHFFEKKHVKEFKKHLYILILNFQINDRGYANCSYSYKTIIDVLNLLKYADCSIDYSKNKYIKRFFLTTNILGITNYKIKCNFFDKIFMLRFFAKKNIRFYSLMDSIICHITKKIILYPEQILEFTVNNEYRRYILKKLFKS